MQINGVHGTVSFKRRLNKEEISDYTKTLQTAKQKAGQSGMSILIVHDPCLPQSPKSNTGAGNLSSQDALKFFETMKNYLGINTIEILPQGPIKSKKGFYCAYVSSALSLGNHVINPELLLTKDFNNLITKKELKQVVKSNTLEQKDSIVNYRNVFDDGSPFDNMLQKAFERFKNLKNDNGLKNRYNKFIEQNSGWLETVAAYERPDNPEFFKFKQFLADEHLKIARQELNKRGLKLIGDCEIGFSKSEVAAFPDAFIKDTYIGLREWGLPALNYDNILNPDSAAHKLLKKKVQLAARRYDSIRFDVSWAYVTPQLTHKNGTVTQKEMGDSLLKLIEGWVKEVKGNDFDVNNLIHEFEASPKDFKAMVSDTELIQPLKGRKKVYSATHMSDNWGSNDAFINYRKWSPDEFVIGVGNHDPQPLRQIALEIPDIVTEDGKRVEKRYKLQQIEPLAKILKIPPQLLKDPVEFAKAKFAEPMMAMHNMVFYMDVFGKKERFDMQNLNNPSAYSHKIPHDFENAYIKAVQEGFGFNVMDSLEKVFKAKGLDKTEPELYKKLIKYRDILLEKEPEKLRSNKKLAAVGAVVVCAGAAIFAVLVKNKKPKTPPQKEVTQATINTPPIQPHQDTLPAAFHKLQTMLPQTITNV